MITIDLGLNGCGVASFPLGGLDLYEACYLRRIDGSAPKPYQMAWTIFSNIRHFTSSRIIVERPRIYTRMKGDPADILNLLEVGATLQGMLGRPVEWIEPHQWKGSVDADVMTERIRSRLTKEELGRIEPCPASLTHNVLDAVGIGLAVLGRLKRKRVVHR